MKPTFSIIGCGRVGTALAVFLSKTGYRPVGFVSKGGISSQRAADLAGSGTAFSDTRDAVKKSEIVFITTPDNLIESVCSSIVKTNGFDRDTVLFHCSGALSSSILGAASKKGLSTGSLHPLQSFAPHEENRKSPFLGINMSVEGDEKALLKGEEIIRDLEANPFTLPTRAKTLYHAAAVVASNYLVTLENFALQLLQEADLSEEKAYAVLEPLIQGTLNNIKERGTKAALTGPVARGDVEIVERHVKDLEALRPDYLELYLLLGRYTLDIARSGQGLDKIGLAGLEAVFSRAGSKKL